MQIQVKTMNLFLVLAGPMWRHQNYHGTLVLNLSQILTKYDLYTNNQQITDRFFITFARKRSIMDECLKVREYI